MRGFTVRYKKELFIPMILLGKEFLIHFLLKFPCCPELFFQPHAFLLPRAFDSGPSSIPLAFAVYAATVAAF